MYTQLGVLTKGTVIEVNVSELGMVTAGGKVVFGKYAQITNNPENDGCINAALRQSTSFMSPYSSVLMILLSRLTTLTCDPSSHAATSRLVVLLALFMVSCSIL